MSSLLQQQAFHSYFDLLGNIVLGWYEQKPKNIKVKQVLKCTNEIGVFTHQLITERDILKIRINQLGDEIVDLKKEIIRLREYEL